jgi:hypothetical protein
MRRLALGLFLLYAPLLLMLGLVVWRHGWWALVCVAAALVLTWMLVKGIEIVSERL